MVFHPKKHSTPNFAHISKKLVSTTGTVIDPTHLRACGASMCHDDILHHRKKWFSTKKTFYTKFRTDFGKIGVDHRYRSRPDTFACLRRQYVPWWHIKNGFRQKKTFYTKFRTDFGKIGGDHRYRSRPDTFACLRRQYAAYFFKKNFFDQKKPFTSNFA